MKFTESRMGQYPFVSPRNKPAKTRTKLRILPVRPDPLTPGPSRRIDVEIPLVGPGAVAKLSPWQNSESD